jgi:hypothetical protein
MPEPDPPRLPDHLSRSDGVFGTPPQLPGNAQPEDGIERWGRRIGRSLAVIAAVVIVALFLWG